MKREERLCPRCTLNITRYEKEKREHDHNLERKATHCHWCGREFGSTHILGQFGRHSIPVTLTRTIGHVLPISSGQVSTDNLVEECNICNSFASNYEFEDEGTRIKFLLEYWDYGFSHSISPKMKLNPHQITGKGEHKEPLVDEPRTFISSEKGLDFKLDLPPVKKFEKKEEIELTWIDKGGNKLRRIILMCNCGRLYCEDFSHIKFDTMIIISNMPSNPA